MDVRRLIEQAELGKSRLEELERTATVIGLMQRCNDLIDKARLAESEASQELFTTLEVVGERLEAAIDRVVRTQSSE